MPIYRGSGGAGYGSTAKTPASEVSIVDAGGLITATDVEGALQENRTNINATVNNLASLVSGQGASLIGINDAGSIITATNVEGALQENRAATNTLISDLASVATGKGASLIGLDLTNQTVEAGVTQNVASYTALRAITPIASRNIRVVSGSGGIDGDFYAATGAAPGTYVDNGGTIIVPTGGDGSAAWLRGYSGAVDVRWFGAKGDGVTDDTSSLQSALTYISSNPGEIEFYGTHITSGPLNFSGTGIVFKGHKNMAAIKRTDTGESIVFNASSSVTNCTFDGLHIESTAPASAVYGLITSLERAIDGLFINNCKFVNSTATSNAVQLVADTGTPTLSNIHINECDFSNIGRMGVEIQSHIHDGTTRINNVYISNNKFSSTGVVSVYGMAVSVSGKSSGVVIDGNVITNAKDTAIEIASGGSNISVCNNMVKAPNAAGCRAIVFTNAQSWETEDISVIGNTTVSNSSPYFERILSGTIGENTFKVSGASQNVLLRDSNDVTFSNNSVYTNSFYGLMVQSTSTYNCANNIVSGNIFDNSSSTTGTYTVVVSGTATATKNYIIGNILLKGTSGAYTGEASSAAGNIFRNNSCDGDPSQGESTNVKLTLSGAATLPADTTTKIVFDVEATDTLAEYNTTSGTFTALRKGLYLIKANAAWTDAIGSTAATRSLRIYLNTVLYAIGGQIVKDISGVQMSSSVEAVISLNAGDTIEFYGQVGSGGSGVIGAATTQSFATISRIR